MLFKSPYQQKQDKNTYNYLKEHSSSNQKFNIDHIKSHLKQNYYNLQTESNLHQQTQYELAVEFQLRREKQKTKILEEKLKSKESFIKQMTQFQDRLTLLYEKCQEELHFYKNQCQDYQNKWNSFGTFNEGALTNKIEMQQSQKMEVLTPTQNYEHIIRQYIEQIAQLKHLIIKLEEEINYYEKKQLSNRLNKCISSSVKNQFQLEKAIIENKTKDFKSHTQFSPVKKTLSKPKINNQKQRSKTMANQFVRQKQNQISLTFNKISEFISFQNKKVSSFIFHFLTMCQFFEDLVSKQTSIKRVLKKAWKWIKSAIIEWSYLKGEKLQKIKQYRIGSIVSKLLSIERTPIEQIEKILVQAFKQSDCKFYKNN